MVTIHNLDGPIRVCYLLPQAFTGGSDLKVEKAMATHSSTLAWQIPWTEELGGLQSMGSLGIRHD